MEGGGVGARSSLLPAAADFSAVAPVAPDAVNYFKSKARVTNIKKGGYELL